jgi:hypothetical protein
MATNSANRTLLIYVSFLWTTSTAPTSLTMGTNVARGAPKLWPELMAWSDRRTGYFAVSLRDPSHEFAQGMSIPP